MGKKKKEDTNTIIKTLTIEQKFSKNELKVIKFMTNISKNIFNSTVFYHSIFIKYKNNIYKDLYVFIKQNKIKVYDSTIDNKLYELYEKYYLHYCAIKNDLENNNKIIYQHIIDKITNKKIIITNNIYTKFKDIIMAELLSNQNIKITLETKYELFDSIIETILKSLYNKNYFLTKYQIRNKIPVTINNYNLITSVKNNKYLFDTNNTTNKTFNYKPVIEKLFEQKLKSDQNYISRFTYRHLGKNIHLLPMDVIGNIIDKTFDSIKSYYGKLEKELKSNLPKYLPKNSHFILPFYDRSRKNVVINGTNMIRLTIGNYVAHNYINITNDSKLICVNMDQATNYKKYIRHNLLKNGKATKKDNYIIASYKNNKYVNKKSKYILDSYYMNIPLPTKLMDPNKTIKLVEIVPIYESETYHIHYKYHETIKPLNNKNNGDCVDDYISIDLGMKNLMTIYNPTGKQHIITGKYLTNLNYTYNDKIDYLKSRAKKLNNLYTTHQIRKLLINRSNKINNYFNLLVKWLVNNYKNKKIIIGYNVNWKTGTSMGKKNNRAFYEIPYCRLLNKLKFKMLQVGSEIIINEESYTSKCDALSFEQVKNQKNYAGTRIKRGLFKSSTGVIINADINAAINIMRKYLLKKKVKIDEIKGISILNPIRINIFHDVISKAYLPVDD